MFACISNGQLSTCFNIYQYVSVCTSMTQHTLSAQGVYLVCANVPVCISICPCSVYANVSMTVSVYLECTHVSSRVIMYLVCTHVSVRVSMYLVCTHVSVRVSVYLVCVSVRQCVPGMCQCVSVCTWYVSWRGSREISYEAVKWLRTSWIFP